MLVLFLLTVLASLFENSQRANLIRYEDKIRIAEAYKISELYGNKLWNSWNDADFIILLVTDNKEFLIRHSDPSDDFTFLEHDSLLQSNIYTRKRVFEKNLLATFPAVNGKPTIVVGTPENTGRTSSDWVITILHEHFHQFQNSQPDYFSGVDSLKLSGGDQTGMWMLNYPFPYDNKEINKQYKILTEALLKLLIPFPADSRLFNRDLNSFLKERASFKKLLTEKDYKYFSFQIWQEGIARYTEYKIADLLDEYEPSKKFSALDDYKSFTEIAGDLRENIFNQLEEWNLKDHRRLCFYSYGAAEGLLLDRINKDWKEKYFKDKFSTEKYFDR